MEAKFTRDEMRWLIDNTESVIDYAGKLIEKLRYVYPKQYSYVSADYLGEVTTTYVSIHDSDGDFIEIPIEYFYKQESVDDLNQRYDDKKKEEEERDAYYLKLEQDNEKSQLRHLMKKYPDVVKRWGEDS
ncbi:hypothetical protein PQE68_gp089 [Bacillus phage vB_BanS_Sophrita]|uniref:Uncharacterized protein n=1 Tax=Bacillus phage vB_BanS_Sophrita TaxID=2894790 RepID=A0AAE8YUQ1_9CAUD|nr:hypothetical protein PQE68_gp089 [Bacillus phage vB_BanS_Sophrita]UGO50680.1 hypothetical protein SOPHRITA_89 [Bacillus phage vB_BanS_Sophrita]